MKKDAASRWLRRLVLRWLYWRKVCPNCGKPTILNDMTGAHCLSCKWSKSFPQKAQGQPRAEQT